MSKRILIGKKTITRINRSFPELVVIVAFFCIMWILLGFNTYTTDYANYEMFYRYALNGVRYPGIEIGYYLFMRACALIGCDYRGFMLIYSMLGTYLMVNSMCKYLKNRTVQSFTLLVYFPYLHIIVIQRNFFACAVVLWAFRYLIVGKERNILKFILTIILAATFHVSSLFALLYILALLDKKRVNAIIYVSLILSMITLVLGTQIWSALSIVLPKLVVYTSDGMDGTRTITKLFLIIYYGGKILFCYLFEKEGENRNSILYKVNILTILILPLAMLNMNFMRLEYNVLILMTVMVFNTFARSDSGNIIAKRKKIWLLRNLYLMYYIFSGFVLLYVFSYESIVQAVWKNNLFFNFLLR